MTVVTEDSSDDEKVEEQPRQEEYTDSEED